MFVFKDDNKPFLLRALNTQQLPADINVHMCNDETLSNVNYFVEY